MEADLGPGKSWKNNHKLNYEHYGLPFFDSDFVTNQTDTLLQHFTLYFVYIHLSVETCRLYIYKILN